MQTLISAPVRNPQRDGRETERRQPAVKKATVQVPDGQANLPAWPGFLFFLVLMAIVLFPILFRTFRLR